MSIKEKLDGLYAQYGQMTVRELLSTTGNIALPTMVNSQALLTMASLKDLRPYAAKRILAPRGAGKAISIQHLTSPTYDSWTEGSALGAADPTVAIATATMASHGKVTLISDLLANTASIDFAAEVGRIHGSCVIQAILDKTVDALGAATTNVKSIGTKADGKEADFTLDNVSDVVKLIVNQGYAPDLLITSYDKVWAAIVADYAKYVFYGAMADFVISGKAPQLLGLECLCDKYFEVAINSKAWDGTDGEKYGLVATRDHSWGHAELNADPVTEIYRLPTALSNYVVTHLDFGVAMTVEPSVGLIKHAA